MAADRPTLTITRLARVLEHHGATELSLPQYRVLGLLSSGHERATHLASRLGVAKPTLTALIDSLVERGHVARETPDGDRRSVRLSITTSGQAVLRRTGAQLRSVLDDVLSRCEHPEAVLGALDEVSRALDQRWAERDAVPVSGPAPASSDGGR